MDRAYFIALMYHRLSDKHDGHNYTVLKSDFEKQLEYLYRNGFTTIIPEDLPNFKNTAEGKYLMLTFDDGNSSDFSIALPALKKYGFKGIFFITCSLVGSDGYVTWKQLNDMHAAGFSIQSHSYTHTLLTQLSRSELDSEIKKAKTVLEDNLGFQANSFSLPGGDVDKLVIDAVRFNDFEFIFSSVPGVNYFNDIEKEKFFRRISITSRTDFRHFQNIVSKMGIVYFELYFNYLIKRLLKKILGAKKYHNFWRSINKITH